jgi:malate dehydrogenase (oxaloacetate-decarboxylating)
MEGMKGTSWQQRYSAPEIYTIRCRISDKPGMLARLCSVIGELGANIGEIRQIDVGEGYKIRDIRVYLAEKDTLKAITERLDNSEGIKVEQVIDDVMEIHRRGSIDVKSRVPIRSLTDLRMLYTPGVAEVCKRIVDDRSASWDYTGICDRVAIVTNGTAVLGLGDIGPLEGLPVMEGKAAIFAEFVDISAFPLLIDTKDADEFVETVVRVADGFGAVQLEDVAAPECFEIEQKLRDKLDIPVFHDDQHGTATITLAALINCLKITGKKAEDCRLIMLGAGAAGIAISKILLEFGIGDIVVYDSAGALYKGRKEKMNPYKKELAEITNKNNQTCSFEEGFSDKDIFIGVSRPDMVSKDMIRVMNPDPIVLPLSNPLGEISKEDALAAGAAVTADGRDINNALAYPGIFRGALDARAPEITLQMQIAAANKIAELAPAEELLPDILDREVHRQAANAVSAAAGK